MEGGAGNKCKKRLETINTEKFTSVAGFFRRDLNRTKQNNNDPAGGRQNGVDQRWRFGSNWSRGDAGRCDLLIGAIDAIDARRFARAIAA